MKQGSRRDESGRKHGRSRDGHWAGMVKDEAVKANERSREIAERKKEGIEGMKQGRCGDGRESGSKALEQKINNHS